MTRKTLRPAPSTAECGTRPSREAFDHWRPIAAAIHDGEISRRGDVSLALVNLKTGVDAVLALRDRLEALEDPSVEAIDKLMDLGAALAFADVQVERMTNPSEVRDTLAAASRTRKLLLAGADALVAAGVFDAARVKKIRSGSGPIDLAGDCVALGKLYRESAAWKERVPFGEAEIAEAERLGTELLLVLRPAAAGSAPQAPEIVAAKKIRAQLWTLLERSWERDLWRAGAWLFGREVDERVPVLGARVHLRAATQTTSAQG